MTLCGDCAGQTPVCDATMEREMALLKAYLVDAETGIIKRGEKAGQTWESAPGIVFDPNPITGEDTLREQHTPGSLGSIARGF